MAEGDPAADGEGDAVEVEEGEGAGELAVGEGWALAPIAPG